MTDADRERARSTAAVALTWSAGVIGLFLWAGGLVWAFTLAEPGSSARLLSIAVSGVGAILIVVSLGANAADVSRVVAGRQFRHGGHAALAVVLAAAVCLFLNLCSARLYATADWTRKGAHTLSTETRNLLASLTDDVTLVAFFDEDSQSQLQLARVQDLLERYRRLTDRVAVRYIDRRDPATLRMEAERFGVAEWNVVVVARGDRRKIVHRGDLFVRSWDAEGRPRETFKGEDTITGALRSLIENEPPTVLFTSGFGEPSIEDGEGAYARIAKEVRDSHMIVGDLLMIGRPAIPDTCDVLVVAAPSQPYAAPQVAAIRDYLFNRGGKAVFLLAPAISRSGDRVRVLPTGLEGLLAEVGVSPKRALIVEPGRRGLTLSPWMFEAGGRMYGSHPITDALEGRRTLWLRARPLVLARRQAGDRFRPHGLLNTSDKAWGETGFRDFVKGHTPRMDKGEDIPGPVAVAAAVTETSFDGNDEPRLVVFGDGDFVSHGAVSPGNANRDLFINAIRWLTRRTASMGIAPKEVDEVYFGVSRRQTVAVVLGVVVLLPLAAVAAGALVWIARRQ